MVSFNSEAGIQTSDTHAVGLLLSPEEQARADVYGLLARLLLSPPDDALLKSLASADALMGDTDQALDCAWEQLSLSARLLPFDAVRDEFNALFISTSIPRINPYGSLYIAGFLHEKPLAALRTDLAHLGLKRRPGAAETEDHLGALCETMRHLIVGGHSLAHQHEFFAMHIAPWSGTCVEHMRDAVGARFYARVADLVSAFFAIEHEAFDVAEDDAPD